MVAGFPNMFTARPRLDVPECPGRHLSPPCKTGSPTVRHMRRHELGRDRGLRGGEERVGRRAGDEAKKPWCRCRLVVHRGEGAGQEEQVCSSR